MDTQGVLKSQKTTTDIECFQTSDCIESVEQTLFDIVCHEYRTEQKKDVGRERDHHS